MIQLPFKLPGARRYHLDWFVAHFPEDYHKLVYVEPFFHCGSLFLKKRKSRQEILNGGDDGVSSIIRAIRDEPQEYVKRLKKSKSDERAFLRAIETTFDDDLDQAVAEFLCRVVSKRGEKTSFEEGEWKKAIEELAKLSPAFRGVYLTQTGHVELLDLFDKEDVFFFIDFSRFPGEKREFCGKLLKTPAKVLLVDRADSETFKALPKRKSAKVSSKGVDELVWKNF